MCVRSRNTQPHLNYYQVRNTNQVSQRHLTETLLSNLCLLFPLKKLNQSLLVSNWQNKTH